MNKKINEGYRPLGFALFSNTLNIAKFLIKNETDANQTNVNEITLIHKTVMRNFKKGNRFSN